MVIMFIISALIFYSLLYCSYPEIKIRRTTSSYWKNYEWESESDKRHKFPLWATLIAVLVCLIPVVNVILAFAAIIYYIIQSLSPDDDDGYDLEIHRYVLGGKFFKFIKDLLTKDI